ALSGIQNVGNHNRLIVVPGIANQNENLNENGNVVAARAWEKWRRDDALSSNSAADYLKGTQNDQALVYDSDGLAEVHEYDNCYNNEIFNKFTQKEQYTKLLVSLINPHP
ncbi:hypothetical protein Tco_1021856, partial [Tanacetum coccineum]